LCLIAKTTESKYKKGLGLTEKVKVYKSATFRERDCCSAYKMTLEMKIRPETKKDHKEVFSVIESAFKDA
jgi:hypothetical protein